MKEKTVTVNMTPEVFDNIVGVVTDILDTIDEQNFETRHDYLGYIAELNEILDTMRRA